MTWRHCLLFCGLMALSVSGEAAPTGEAVVRAADGIAVHVYEYRPSTTSAAPPILMFHMAGGDARGELDEIALRLSGSGRHVFAADLRGGGDRIGRGDPTVAHYVNQTARAFREPPGLCTAYADAKAALDHVARMTGRGAILTGSSYSAALVVQLAARHVEQVVGFVAFSPASGAPMAGCEPEPWLERVQVPGWAVRPEAEAKIDWIVAQREVWARHGVATAVYPLGAHGTSILLARRAGGDTEPVWREFTAFLDSLGPDQRIVADSGDWRLGGELRRGIGDGPRPAVLLLNSTGGNRQAYRRLASQLARQGITSLRIDLRGHGESTNAGRFDPDRPDLSLINEAWRDVRTALDRLRSMTAIDPVRVAIVGAGYSAEAMAEAARRSGDYVKAYVALSPGSFSEASAHGIDESGARWLLVHSRDARFAPPVVARAQDVSQRAEVMVVPGARHGTDLLGDRDMPGRLVGWLLEVLA